MAQPPAPPQPPPGNYPQQPGGPPGGYPPYGYGQQPYFVPQSNGIAVAAGIVGIISLVISLIPFFGFVAIPGGIVALVLGIIGRQRANSMGGLSKGMAITGIVTGSIAIVLPIVFGVVLFSYYANHVNDFTFPSFTPFPS